MTTNHYPPPVDKLLALGDPRNMIGWPDYVALGLGLEHSPDLIRMALDEELHWADSDSLEVWSPIHAWRALGQLRAESAVEPLLGLLHRIDDDQDDWVGEELPEVYGMIGPAAIPVLATYLADASHGHWARVAAAASLTKLGQQHPESRSECVAVLTRQLERYTENTEALNGDLIAELLDLKAVESAPVMERAFAAGQVEQDIAGDWEDVQIDLGLRRTRETPKPNYAASMIGPELAKFAALPRRLQGETGRSSSGSVQRRKAKKRDKRKQQEPRSKKSRKK